MAVATCGHGVTYVYMIVLVYHQLYWLGNPQKAAEPVQGAMHAVTVHIYMYI